jgi:hypothetical protein
MKVTLDLKNNVCTVTKESGDPRFSGGYALPESTFLYHVLKALKAQGYDVIKKRMWKDGHMVDNTQQYIRTRKYMTTPVNDPHEFAIYNLCYSLEDLGEEFNKIKAGESIELAVIR